MKTTPDIEMLVTQIVARDVAAGVEFARSLGYRMPVDFAVGVKFIHDTHEMTHIRIRLDDVTHDAIVRLPRLDGDLSLRAVDAMWKAAWERIHEDALTVAQVWIDKHPQARPNEEGSVKMLAILDAMKADDDLQERWLKSCAERAKHFTYTTRRS